MADLTAFVAVAEERSFTRAASKLGMSQSALSQIVRRLERNLSLTLLNRTTRSVAPTEAGERLLETLVPALQGLDASLTALRNLREAPAGTIRLSSVEHATATILTPALTRLLPLYPRIAIEIIDDYQLVDVVADRFDAGIRLGEQVDRDMIAVRIGPDFETALVASPDYLDRNPTPRKPEELTHHSCLGLRLPTTGGLWQWPFRKGEQELNLRTQGAVSSNTINVSLQMALAGLGFAYLPFDVVASHITAGRLVRALEEWTPISSGYHLYYPKRRQPNRAFSLLVDALRFRA